MKNTTFTLILFISITSNSFANDVLNTKTELNSTQRLISQLTTQDGVIDIQNTDKNLDTLSNAGLSKRQIVSSERGDQKAQAEVGVLDEQNSKDSIFTDMDSEKDAKALRGQKEIKKKSSYSNDKTSSKETEVSSSQSSSSSDGSTSWIGTIMLVAAGIFLWLKFKKKNHCPKCGKWFTMNSLGDVSVREHDYNGKTKKRGARKRYECSNCGHRTQFVEWFN